MEQIVELKAGKHTDAILSVISKQDLIDVLEEYHLLSGYENEDITGEVVNENIASGLYSPKKELKKIEKVLEQIPWLNSQERKDTMRAFMVRLALLNELGREYVIGSFTKKTFKTGGRRREKPFLDYLIFRLVQLFKGKTGKPQYEMVGLFLYEQGLAKSWREVYIRRGFKRAMENQESISKAMNNVQKLRLLKLRLLELEAKYKRKIPKDIMHMIEDAFLKT